MQIQKLDHVGIRVMDVARSMRFYETLGFQVIRKDYKEQVFVVRHPDGVEINLIANGSSDLKRRNVLMDIDKNIQAILTMWSLSSL